MKKFKIGLLNFGEIDRIKDYMDAIQELIDYAQLADQLGYNRFWLGEHYLYRKAQCWTNPEMLIPLLAGCTEKISIGVAGSLVSIHNPVDIATNYKLLANLFPTRIDLGFAKGKNEQLQHIFSNVIPYTDEQFYKNVYKTAEYFINEEFNFNNGLTIPPILGSKPKLWLLGSSYKNIDFCLKVGANFSRSIFHLKNDSTPNIEVLEDFKSHYFSKFGIAPQINLTVAACCSHDEQLIKKIIHSSINPVPFDPNGVLFGSPARLNDQLCNLSEKYGVDEFIVLQLYEKQCDRLTGIELLAKELNLHL